MRKLKSRAVAVCFVAAVGCQDVEDQIVDLQPTGKADGQVGLTVMVTPVDSHLIRIQCNEWFSCDLTVTVDVRDVFVENQSVIGDAYRQLAEDPSLNRIDLHEFAANVLTYAETADQPIWTTYLDATVDRYEGFKRSLPFELGTLHGEADETFHLSFGRPNWRTEDGRLVTGVLLDVTATHE